MLLAQKSSGIQVSDLVSMPLRYLTAAWGQWLSQPILTVNQKLIIWGDEYCARGFPVSAGPELGTLPKQLLSNASINCASHQDHKQKASFHKAEHY